MNIVSIHLQQLVNIKFFRIKLFKMRFKKIWIAIAKDKIEDIAIVNFDRSYA